MVDGHMASIQANGKVARGPDMGCHVAPIHWLMFFGKIGFGLHQVRTVDLFECQAFVYAGLPVRLPGGT
jgi:hypothetical protein